MKRKIIITFASLLICFGVSVLGAAITTPAIGNWYASLNKPFFNPPNWIFGPVWTLLYFLMAISLSIIWNKNGAKKIFFLQLFLNFLWSFVFFYFHQPLLAFIVIILLWTTILKTILDFKKISPLAAGLLVPYILWVSFALILNLSIVILN